MDTALYQSGLPTPEEFAEGSKKCSRHGIYRESSLTWTRGNDPNKYDRYNWTASPAELQRMVDQMAAAREAVGPKHRYLCRHARRL